MWNTSVKIEYIAGLIVDALENYSVNRENAQFRLVIEELRNHFTNCSEEEITDIISLCMKMYSSKKIEHAELVLTAPDSFRVKTLRTKDTMRNLIENTEKSLTITGYSISDYFAEMLDVIIKKSQQGVYVRLYVNDTEKQKEVLERLMSYRSRFLQIYNTIKDITNKGADIQEMNDILLKHEEYYMKKASISKMGGTIYGDLFLIRQIAYDYYLFYKKNHLIEQLESFSFLLSLCKLNYEQNSRIVKAFVLLLTPDEKENVRTITNNIYALSIYVKQHFDKDIKGYGDLLKLLINSDILLEATAHSNAYPELIQILSELADKKIYNNCCKEFDRIKDNNRQKTLWVYIHRRVLLKYDESEWKNYIEENLNNNWEQEIFQLLYEKILSFNDKIKEYYVNKLKKYASSNKGVYSYPDHKAEAINQLVIYILLDIANENDIEFMKEYAYMSDYLEFIFNPESFDYRNIKISDTMWCNFINSDHYRERILEHKSEFWNKEEEKRIELGFGSSFENRVAYKYLFD